ncbi:hypothetical protein AB0B79_16005 [Streptomyces sp. NPDC039022]|uniref:hypothetical protein n=1 Tax=unclassified Streptomyces TaxID=2593676 RepID=UPI0033FB8FF6
MTDPTPHSTAPIILPLPLETAPAPVEGCAGDAEPRPPLRVRAVHASLDHPANDAPVSGR